MGDPTDPPPHIPGPTYHAYARKHVHAQTRAHSRTRPALSLIHTRRGRQRRRDSRKARRLAQARARGRGGAHAPRRAAHAALARRSASPLARVAAAASGSPTTRWCQLPPYRAWAAALLTAASQARHSRSSSYRSPSCDTT